jgi:SAM-dependent methyltransferase
MSADQRPYVLGSDPSELERPDRQAAMIERPTRTILQAAGLSPGQRVLDLGTGLGHVARIAAELVGPSGSVVGLDGAGDALAVARERVGGTGEHHVSFVQDDVRTFRAPQPFDAITGRLILFHLADPAGVVRHHLTNLRSGGTFVAIDFDLGACRAEPDVPLVANALHWVTRAFTAAGAAPRIGARLGPILRDAGLTNVATLGLQGYVQPGDAAAGRLLGGVVRSLAPAIVANGIARAEQLELETLDERITKALTDADAVLLPPIVVGAWGRA